MSAPYWEYLRWAGYALACVGGWRYIPLGVIRLVAAFTRDEQRHRRCMEVLRLTRRDASSIPSYLSSSATATAPPENTSSDDGRSSPVRLSTPRVSQQARRPSRAARQASHSASSGAAPM